MLIPYINKKQLIKRKLEALIPIIIMIAGMVLFSIAAITAGDMMMPVFMLVIISGIALLMLFICFIKKMDLTAGANIVISIVTGIIFSAVIIVCTVIILGLSSSGNDNIGEGAEYNEEGRMLLSEDNYVLVVREYDENNADQAAELFGKVINNKY